MFLKDIIQSLEEDENPLEKDAKLEIYSSILRYLKSEKINLNVVQVTSQEFLKFVIRDALDNNVQIVNAVLEVLHLYLTTGIFESLNHAEYSAIKDVLIKCGLKMVSMDSLRWSLKCLTALDFKSDDIVAEVLAILGNLEEMRTKFSQQETLLAEIVTFFFSLEKKIGKLLIPSSPSWAIFVFPGLVHRVAVVRDKTFYLLEKFLQHLINVPVLSKHLIKIINAGFGATLKQVFPKNELFVLKAWIIIVKMIGKELHKGPTINTLLEVIEMGFKGLPECRVQSFIAWKSLIHNFALDKNVLLDQKRIKLLLLVLKIDNAKSEEVALEKLKTWWYFLISLGPKLSSFLEEVVNPLLMFCSGYGRVQITTAKVVQPSRLALTSPTASSPVTLASTPNGSNQSLPVFAQVQKLAFEVLVHLLSDDKMPKGLEDFKWTLEPLPNKVFTSNLSFVKFSSTIYKAIETVFKTIGNGVDDCVVLCIWTRLTYFVKEALKESATSEVKIDCRDMYSNYLSLLNDLVQSDVFSGDIIQKMLSTSIDFPPKVLASTAYNISGYTSMKGCPALLLIELLSTKKVVESCKILNEHNNLFSHLVTAGTCNIQGALPFLHSVAKILDSQAEVLLTSDLFFSTWITLAQTLNGHINKVNDVNQGDALEYNFDCMLTTLLLPIKHQLVNKLLQVCVDCKILNKTWKELYSSFARLSALVPTAEANVCLEQLTAKIIKFVFWYNLKPQSFNKVPTCLEFLASLCSKMVDCVDFSSISLNRSIGSGLTISPSKWASRRQRPMGILHSLVHLLAILQTKTNKVLSVLEEEKNIKKCDRDSITTAVHSLVEAFTKLFTHITTNTVIINCIAILADPIAYLFRSRTKSSAIKVFFESSILLKLEKLWQEITLCVSSRYSGPYDSELLEKLSPLLVVTLSHTRRDLKSKSLSLWNSTFSRLNTLVYPETLKPVLAKLKEQTIINLPVWIPCDEDACIVETPYSEMSMGESQVFAPVLPDMPSPKRQKGSLLNRNISPARRLSPNPKVSPVKVVDPKTHSFFSSARKNISVDFLPNEEFVVISSPRTRSKRILTDHQKEVLKSKRESSADITMVHSSESQDRSVKLLGHRKMIKETSRADNSSVNFLPPQTRKSAPRKQSVRIEELSPDGEKAIDIAKTQEKVDKDDDTIKISNEKRMSTRSSKNTRGSSMESLLKSGKDLVNSEVTTSNIDSGEHECESSVVSQNSVVESSEQSGISDSPFDMFRSKSHSLETVDPSQDSSSPVPKSSSASKNIPQPRSVSLKSTSSKAPQDSLERVPKLKTPRRVPLKKIIEQVNKKTESLKDQSSPEHPGTSRTFVDKVKKNANKRNSSNLDISKVLVEDTQSPQKMAKAVTHEVDHCIFETPTKSDDNQSPPLKSSARKLFVDADVNSDSASLRFSPTSANHDPVISKENEGPNQTALVPSSQGFGTCQSSTVVSGDQCQVNEKEKKSGKSGDMPESENLFPSSEEAAGSPLDMMPTMASPTKTLQKYSQSKSSTSSSGESSKTTSISSTQTTDSSPVTESDFNPSQSTLQEEEIPDNTVNKRKKKTPIKYVFKQMRRAKRANPLKKKCPCCPLNVKSPHHERRMHLSDAKNLDKPEKTSQDLGKVMPCKKHEPCKDQISISPVSSGKTKNKAVKEALAEKGEVTPQVKSPPIANPQRRHSAVKKRGGLSKKRARESASEVHFALKDKDSESDDSVRGTGPKRRREAELEEHEKKTSRELRSRGRTSPKDIYMLRSKKSNKRLALSREPFVPAKKRKRSTFSTKAVSVIQPLQLEEINQGVEDSIAKNSSAAREPPRETADVNRQVVDAALSSALSALTASFQLESQHSGAADNTVIPANHLLFKTQQSLLTWYASSVSANHVCGQQPHDQTAQKEKAVQSVGPISKDWEDLSENLFSGSGPTDSNSSIKLQNQSDIVIVNEKESCCEGRPLKAASESNDTDSVIEVITLDDEDKTESNQTRSSEASEVILVLEDQEDPDIQVIEAPDQTLKRKTKGIHQEKEGNAYASYENPPCGNKEQLQVNMANQEDQFERELKTDNSPVQGKEIIADTEITKQVNKIDETNQMADTDRTNQVTEKEKTNLEEAKGVSCGQETNQTAFTEGTNQDAQIINILTGCARNNQEADKEGISQADIEDNNQIVDITEANHVSDAEETNKTINGDCLIEVESQVAGKELATQANVDAVDQADNMKVVDEETDMEVAGHEAVLEVTDHGADTEVTGHEADIDAAGHEANIEVPEHEPHLEVPGHEANIEVPGRESDIEVPGHEADLEVLGNEADLVMAVNEADLEVPRYEGDIEVAEKATVKEVTPALKIVINKADMDIEKPVHMEICEALVDREESDALGEAETTGAIGGGQTTDGIGQGQATDGIGEEQANAIESEVLDHEKMILHDWSPSKSPSCSILKKTVTDTPPSGQSRRVSFAEPVVSGESPIREKYHSEALPTSPLISCREKSGRKGSFSRSLMRLSGYRRKLDSSPKKESPFTNLMKKPGSPVKAQLSQGTHKPTQESQLDSTGPIFPDLIGCCKPLDDILPQLTSSLWYRGLCQLMKGRNLNTIGDLSSLTEVQINQLPIRNPKVQTVKTTLASYMGQHGLLKVPICDETKEALTSQPTKEVGPENLKPDEINQDQRSGTVSQDLPGENDIEQISVQEKAVSQAPNDNSLVLSTLSNLKGTDLKNTNTSQLFEIHTALLTLTADVVEEIKSRHMKL
ncbi:unnamed protein product [Lymnaea stagnalis]|uniref:Telomere-associated protein RIF1 n=1 Tax=Lymnaea stagnalis TaxID=6523 RepID=A0AAV2IMW6_LYMST